MRSIETTGKSVDVAIFSGLQELEISIDAVTIEILQTETKGILGIGARPAKVRLTEKPPEAVTVPDFDAERERRDRERRRDEDSGYGRRDNRRGRGSYSDRASDEPAAGRREYEEKAERPERTEKTEKPGKSGRAERFGRGDKTERPERTGRFAKAEGAEKPADSARNRKPDEQDEKVRAKKTIDAAEQVKPVETASVEQAANIPAVVEGTADVREAEANDASRRREANDNGSYPAKRNGRTEEKNPVTPERQINYTEEDAQDNPAADFVTGLISRMGVEGKVLAAKEPDAIRLRIDSGAMGVLIGHRGETLDAMQYLTSLVINKNRKADGYTRVTLNTEDYREKREETLVRLAKRVASQVKATGRSRVLEPMNPYERRILHATLQNNPYVTTHSEGDEPNRRVVVTLKRRNRHVQS